jgi:two-component system sensor histidine kinase PhcS
LSNARDALANGAKAGGKEISIRAEAVDVGEKKRVRLPVRDNGPGIAAENLERVFQPFFATKADRGNGLGLAVSRGIAKEHGGRLWAESALREYCEFILELPAEGAEDAGAAHRAD